VINDRDPNVATGFLATLFILVVAWLVEYVKEHLK